MLNIPNEIKALFKNGSAFKNFHVHFPNGENADLNNDDIVAESVQFTESICSKEVFQFGLSERSQIEFECVGVQNIFGMTIECAIEISLDMLEDEAQFITDHPNTGNESFLDPQICTYGTRNMYRVPYGRFIIESCPRSQGAMKHRKVNAYSIKFGAAEVAFEQFKMSIRRYNTETYTPSAHYTVAQYAETLRADMTAETLTYNIQNTGRENWNLTLDTATQPAEKTVCLYVDSFADDPKRLVRKTFGTKGTTAYNDPNALYTIKLYKGADYNACMALAKSKADELNLQWLEVNQINGASFYSEHLLPSNVYKQVITYPNVPYNDKGDHFEITMYPYLIDDPSLDLFAWEGYTGRFDLAIYDNNTGTYEILLTDQNIIDHIEITKYTTTETEPRLFFNSTLKTEETATTYPYVTFINAYSVTDLIDGWSELSATFAKVTRGGDSDFIRVSKDAPIAMTPAEYSELWWDEYDVSEVGAVTYSYLNGDSQEEQTNTYTFGNGASRYEMTDNALLKNLNTSGMSESETYAYAENLIITEFVPHLGSISFTPVNLDALGLPYLEAGDYLEIDNADGGTVGTYILTRTLSGIQTLTDSIESKGGEVLGNG